ncbi:Protein of unknown function [Cotesia congregata]|uniref:Uncharacterized protein n=1 Tax=Cotesia congregata TaxID=51543 RepID=A0A8J2MXY6_COTCN|nr:Protein of unknown function [Cotesia congregata]
MKKIFKFKALILFKDIIINNRQLDSLPDFPRFKPKSPLNFNIISTSLSGTIFSKIINSASLIKISTNPGDSNIKSPNIFHHSIMSRLKEDPHLINIININTLGFRPLKFSLDFTEITLCPFADLPAKVSSTDHLSGGQNTIKRSAFGAFSQDLFMSHHLELLQGQSGVFLPQFPQSVDVVLPGALKFSGLLAAAVPNSVHE